MAGGTSALQDLPLRQRLPLIEIASYFGLFLAIGAVFVFANLLVGRLVRPHDPHPAKTEVYECGEPTIGSSYIQFDLRFYVVALLFIIFDVEVAFFFPWAVVAGKANMLRDESVSVAVATDTGGVALTPEASGLLREIGLRDLSIPSSERLETSDAEAKAALVEEQVRDGATTLAWIAIADIAIFFAVLAVGFAYVWKRGDLDWVRAAPRRFSGATPRDDRPDGFETDEPAPIAAADARTFGGAG